ncbi:MAG: response regulator transcription factor [bacterium]
MKDKGDAGSDETRETRVLVLADVPDEAVEIIKRLTNSEGLSFVADAQPTKDAIKAIKQFRPDIVLLDIHAEEMDPLFLIKSIRAKFPEKPMLLFSPLADPLFAARVLRAGARGYLMNTDIPQCMVKAIRELLTGGRYVSEKPMQGILHGLAETTQPGRTLPIEKLSDRELVIFRFIGQGQDVYQIARELDLSIKTVITHRYNIKKKLQLPTLEVVASLAVGWVHAQNNPTPSVNP